MASHSRLGCNRHCGVSDARLRRSAKPTAINALLTLSLAPIAILAGAALIGAERPAARQLVGALISIFGAAILITRGEIAAVAAAGFNSGDLWMLLGVGIFAVYSLLLRRRPADLPAGVALAASMSWRDAARASGGFHAGTELVAFKSAPVVLGIGYVSIFSSVFAFLFWTYGVSQLGPARSGQFIHLTPVFGAALAAAVLGETPTLPQVTGGALVLLGIFVVERRK